MGASLTCVHTLPCGAQLGRLLAVRHHKSHPASLAAALAPPPRSPAGAIALHALYSPSITLTSLLSGAAVMGTTFLIPYNVRVAGWSPAAVLPASWPCCQGAAPASLPAALCGDQRGLEGGGGCEELLRSSARPPQVSRRQLPRTGAVPASQRRHHARCAGCLPLWLDACLVSEAPRTTCAAPPPASCRITGLQSGLYSLLTPVLALAGASYLFAPGMSLAQVFGWVPAACRRLPGLARCAQPLTLRCDPFTLASPTPGLSREWTPSSGGSAWGAA